MFFRACDCTWIPCAHNPSQEYREAKQKLEQFDEELAKMSKPKKIWFYKDLRAERSKLAADVAALHWQKAAKHYA